MEAAICSREWNLLEGGWNLFGRFNPNEYGGLEPLEPFFQYNTRDKTGKTMHYIKK